MTLATVQNGIVLADAKLELRPVRIPPLDYHAPSVYLANLSAGSRRSVLSCINKIAQLLTGGRCDQWTLPWGRCRVQHVAAIRAHVAETYSLNYARKIVQAFKGVLRWAWRLEQISTEALNRALDVPIIRGKTLLAGREISMGEMQGLFLACSQSGGASGIRDAAIIGVLYGGGLRRGEVVALDLDDYDRETGELRVLKAKGNKDRLVYIGAGGRAALDAWIELRGIESGPLFLATLKGGKTTDGAVAVRRLSDQTVYDLLIKRCRQANIKPHSVHNMRRSFVSHLIDAGADLKAVSDLAGHENVATTARYDRRGERGKKRAADMLHIPFVPVRKK